MTAARGDRIFTDGTAFDNEPQPDALLRILPEFSGQSKTVDGYVEGAPELVAEVSASTASYDLHSKMNAYRRNAVREYVVWRVWDRAIDWFILRQGQFERMQAGDDGVFRSEVFPSLWLDAPALLAGNLQQVNDVVRQGVGSSDHGVFVRALQRKKSS